MSAQWVHGAVHVSAVCPGCLHLPQRRGPSSQEAGFLLFRQSGDDGGGGGVLRPTADNVPQLLRHELTDLLIEIGPSLERQTRWWENVREDPRRWSPVGF